MQELGRFLNIEDTFLRCLNPREYQQDAVLGTELPVLGAKAAETFRGSAAEMDGEFIRFTIPGRDASVYKLVYSEISPPLV